MKKLSVFLLSIILAHSALAQLVAPTIAKYATYDGSNAIANVGFGLTNNNSGGVICYTIDGSTPTAPTAGTCSGGTTQTWEGVEAFVYVNGAMVNAIATESGQTNSSVATTGPLAIEAAAPVYSINTGIYTYALSVALLAPQGANAPQSAYVICYTVNGATPTASNGLCTGTTLTYSSPIVIASGSSEEITAMITQTTTLNSTIPTPQIYTVVASRSPQTWYVRPDGGSRYSINMTSGQCNGMADTSLAMAETANPGVTVNLPCAFNDVRYLWQDSSYNEGYTNGTASFPGWGWIIAGGDTVIIRGSIGTGVSYRIGYNPQGYVPPTTGDSYCDDAQGNFIGCWGVAGNPRGSGAPPPPSGTSAQHTVIEGENFAACHTASAKTQLYGGSGVFIMLSYVGASYVDMACLDITDHSSCGTSGQLTSCYVDPLNEAGYLDYALTGVQWYNTSTYDTLTDAHIHGIASAAMNGAPGTGTVLSYIDMLGNSSSGWNTDDGSGTSGVGTLLVQHFNIGWNGCSEEYPIVDTVPYFDCTDDNSGGYGDGFGTATVGSPAPGWQVHFDQGNVFYNTQDGLDALHIAGPGSTMTDTRVLAYGNEGNQLKVGGATATIQNSVIVGNCEALGHPIPGTPPGYNSDLFTGGSNDICRGNSTAVVFETTPGDPATFQNNTIYTEGEIGVEVEYATPNIGSTNTLNFDNNVFVGFYNAGAGANPTTIYSNTDLNMLTNPGASWTNNVTFGQRANWTCPKPGESNAICTDPGLVDETYHAYSYGDMSPLVTGSVVRGAGEYISAIPLDFVGASRSNPPSIGAYESNYSMPLSSILVTTAPINITELMVKPPTLGTTVSLPVTYNSASTVVGGNVTVTSQCVYTGYTNSDTTLGSNSYIPCPAMWTDTGAHSSVGSTTGVITGTSTGSDTVTATVSSITGQITVPVASATLSTITVTPNPGVVPIGGNTTFSAACLYSDGTTTPCSVVWTDSTSHTIIGSATGVVLGVNAGQDTIMARINTVYGTATISAANKATLSTITVTPSTGSVSVGSSLTFSAACLYSDGTTTPCGVAWTDTGAHSNIGSTTGLVTGVSVGSDTVTATISTIYGQATVTVAAPAAFVPMQGLLLYGRHN